MFDGKAVKPERKLCQVYGQRIKINPVDAMLCDLPPPVVGTTGNRNCHPLDMRYFFKQGDDQTGHLVGRIHQEMTAAHCRIAHLEA